MIRKYYPNPGYLTFLGHPFGSDIPLLIAVYRFWFIVPGIEIFRPPEYGKGIGDPVGASFTELSAILRKKYGEPTLQNTTGPDDCREEWQLPGLTVEHYRMDRFGPEEHLKITFRRVRRSDPNNKGRK